MGVGVGAEYVLDNRYPIYFTWILYFLWYLKKKNTKLARK